MIYDLSKQSGNFGLYSDKFFSNLVVFRLVIFSVTISYSKLDIFQLQLKLADSLYIQLTEILLTVAVNSKHIALNHIASKK